MEEYLHLILLYRLILNVIYLTLKSKSLKVLSNLKENRGIPLY